MTSNTHNQNLAYEYYRHYQQKSSAIPEMKSGLPGFEGLCIEHVPELQENKYSEKQRQLVGSESRVLVQRQFPEFGQ